MASSLSSLRCWALALLALASAACVAKANGADLRVAHVSGLYQRYAWELVGWNAPTLPLAAQNLRELERWFTAELAQAIASDHRCTERTREICRLDFALLWGSQDPDVAHVEIRNLDPVTVRVLLKPSGLNAMVSPLQVDARMLRTRQGWRIADLVYGNGRTSLKQLLMAPSPP